MQQHIDGWQIEPSVSVDYGANPLSGEPMNNVFTPPHVDTKPDGCSGASEAVGFPSPKIESGGHMATGTVNQNGPNPNGTGNVAQLF